MTDPVKTETVKTDRAPDRADRATAASDRVPAPAAPALPLSARELTRAEQREKKAAEEEERLRQQALQTVHDAPEEEPANPPEQPAMVPARQIPGDVAAAPRRPLTAATDGPKPTPLRVRATKLGYYDDKLRRVGDVFDISGPDAFSRHWMERVSNKAAAHTSTRAPELDRKAAVQAPLGGEQRLREEEATGNRDVLDQ